ncbi:hypothetical protein [Pseudomonas sp. GV071]|jgi:hypothetical protein|uniref:hypothetical protein n=1 Tax=Pseudomonas sp. GV071 TaxID=2135754 RepID=UPI000D3C4B0C|nr:hypothetical protein [Pseudomonas sp. GV071]
MKRIELTPAWFGQCPRYLSAESFCHAAGLEDRQDHIKTLMDQGVLPARQIGRYVMVDMHQLMLMLPSDAAEDLFVD